jgi:hypothetical protein
METHSLEAGYVLVDKDNVAASDVVFLEARLKDDVTGNLNEVVSLPQSPGPFIFSF